MTAMKVCNKNINAKPMCKSVNLIVLHFTNNFCSLIFLPAFFHHSVCPFDSHISNSVYHLIILHFSREQLQSSKWKKKQDKIEKCKIVIVLHSSLFHIKRLILNT